MTATRRRGPNLGKVVRDRKCRHCGCNQWYRVRWNYHLYHGGREGWRCASCQDRHRKNWKERNRDQYRNWSWRERGIRMTVDEYNLRYLAQGGQCATCDRKRPKLFVDHDHATGRTRDLLCGRCNVLAQKPDVVARVLAYMERHDG